MLGKIIKGIGGFYYVHTEPAGVYTCKAKGIFRKEKIKPLVGDNVEIDILEGEDASGNIREILPRKNVLLRPAVANVDQVLVMFAMARPNPSLHFLDRILVSVQSRGIPVVICFNKCDVSTAEERARLSRIYRRCGCSVYFTSVAEGSGIGELKEALEGKTTAMAGPSGVGKSSMVNRMYPEAEMTTGEVSRKIHRGRHTTRHSELFSLGEGTYLLDSPGFGTLWLDELDKDDLGQYFMEFAEYEPQCRFQGCTHLSEPDCAVRRALDEGEVSPERYESYRELYEELRQMRRY